MIRIDLVDNTTSVKHVDFHVIPVINDKDFACVPPGILPLRAVMRLSRRVEAGHAFGKMGEYLWYRLKETPAGKHKTPMGSHRKSTALRRHRFPGDVLDRRSHSLVKKTEKPAR